jgi:thioester reductase-like protein
MPRTILFTGFPGFIGARLIPRLLDDDPEAVVVALVEPHVQERARALAAELSPERIRIQPGDITRPRLGLDEATWRRLSAETVEVFHLAAVYDLAVKADLALRVNVLGTQNVVAFCRACERLERHVYVSTAYVAGLRSGLVLEDELAAGQAFKNHYESTKFAAEVAVRNAMEFDGVPTTILRPAIVVGDSRTGETSKFDGPYYLLRTFSALRGPLPRLGSPDARFNVVPIDFVIEAMATAAREDRALGRTLHLVDPEPLCSREVADPLAREYDGRTPSVPMPEGLLARAMGIGPVGRLFGGAPVESLPYLNHPVAFDVSNAAEILAPHGLRCPRFSEYAGVLVDFFRAHEDDPEYAPAR